VWKIAGVQGEAAKDMGNVKCTSFLSIKNYWNSRSTDTEKEFLEGVTPELRETYRALAPEQWLSVEQTLVLEEAMAKFLFPEETETVGLCKLGALMARLDLNGLTKLLLKIASVPYAVQQATIIWHNYHDRGETFVEQPGKTHLRFLIFDYPTLPPKYRILVGGWIQGLLELCGAKNPAVTLQPATPHIAYDIHWE
jgi:hypothetical protein